MNEAHDASGLLILPLVLLAAAVLSVPLARLLRLSAIIAYLAAGVAIGPFGLGLFATPESILPVAEIGVVMLLFLIGLELELKRLVEMRRAIFGLGLAQLVITAAVIAEIAYVIGPIGWRGAVLGGVGLAMSATAIALRILDDRGELQQGYGQRAFATLLFQDMAVVPLLALLPLLAPDQANHAGSFAETVIAIFKILAAMAAVVIAGRYLLNPLFRLLAGSGAREVMTAASLLVVLGAAALMQFAGMSMALGAFLAGVVLAESSYRHEFEADIEPFRGLLLALFFMGIGMSIDMAIVWANLSTVLGWAAAVIALKLAAGTLVFRLSKSSWRDALRGGAILTPAGEFTFVLIPLGVSLAIMSSREGSILSAIAALTMLFGPPIAELIDVVLDRFDHTPEREADDFDGAHGSVLLIGFGRFGQIIAQCLLSQKLDVITIDNDVEMIETAERFGFKVFYGDGTRLDVLRAAITPEVRLVAVCVDERDAANKIVDLIHADFPGMLLYVRSFDRRHTLELIAKGVDFEQRETFESALLFGRRMLEGLGLDAERATATEEDIRRRDLARLALQQAEGIMAGGGMTYSNIVRPEPLTATKRKKKADKTPEPARAQGD